MHPLIKEWLNGLESYALKAALSGKRWPGYKLVSGQSRRKMALTRIRLLAGYTEEIYQRIMFIPKKFRTV